MFNGRLKITVICAAELQETNFMKRLQLTDSAPPVQLDPYVAIDVDEVDLLTTFQPRLCPQQFLYMTKRVVKSFVSVDLNYSLLRQKA